MRIFEICLAGEGVTCSGTGDSGEESRYILPVPAMSHSALRVGYSWIILDMTSNPGLFRPDRRWETAAREIPILSAKSVCEIFSALRKARSLCSIFQRKIGESQIFTNVKQKSVNGKLFQAIFNEKGRGEGAKYSKQMLKAIKAKLLIFNLNIQQKQAKNRPV